VLTVRPGVAVVVDAGTAAVAVVSAEVLGAAEMAFCATVAAWPAGAAAALATASA
jgi:hypothetical protein